MSMLTVTRIINYINRMRAIRRWGRENDDSIIYQLANSEVQWWKITL